MDLDRLRAFQAVAELASFSRAADRLGVKRSSVSRSIAALERSLGVQLVNRTTRSVALTTAGSALYARVTPKLDELEAALRSLPEREKEPSGVVRVTTSMDIGAVVLAPLIPGFILRYPRVEVDARITNEVVDLVGEGFDVALRVARKRLTSSSLVARKVSALDIELYGSPAYLARMGTPRSPSDLERHDWVSFRSLKPPPPCAKVKLKTRVAVDDMFFLVATLRAGAGLGMVPSFVAAPEVSAGRLVRVLPKVKLALGALYIVHPPAHHVPRKTAAFCDYVVEHLQRNPLTGK